MSSVTPDLYLDPDTGDIDVDLLGRVRLTQTLREEVGQRLATRLQFFLGEWFLDTSLGIPYYRDVLVRTPDLGVIKALFAEAITSDPGVESLVSLDLELDAESRQIRVTFEAVLRSGETLQVLIPEQSPASDDRMLVIGGVPITIGGVPIYV